LSELREALIAAPIGKALFFFAWSLLLAQLEIQIEGRHGWAESLPAWKFDRPWILRLTNGRPMTGYHFFMVASLLLALHLPLLYVGFSWKIEAELLSFFFLMTVFWDFMWFICNPAFGLARFRKGGVWWMKSWIWRVPTEYAVGTAGSFGCYVAPAAMGLLSGNIRGLSLQWLTLLGAFAVMTTLVAIVAAVGSRKTPGTPASVDEESQKC
jgi:hypothetical protein